MSLPGTEILFEELGYIVARRGNELRFCCRQTCGPAIGAFISGGVLFILSMNLILLPLSLQGQSDPLSIALLTAILVAVAALAAGVFTLFFRLWKRRSAMSLDDALVVSVVDGVIRGVRGEPLAPVDQAHTRIRIDWTKNARGITRVVWLVLLRHSFAVFKTPLREDAERVQQLLSQFGVRATR